MLTKLPIIVGNDLRNDKTNHSQKDYGWFLVIRYLLYQ